jgi:hypothetical protein
MDVDQTLLGVDKRNVYDLSDAELGVAEPQAEVWEALEALVSSDLNTRRAGLDALIAQDVAHRSPLVAYTLATRLYEPDVPLRTRVVQVLGDVLQPSHNGRTTITHVRLHLGAYLAQMRTRRIYALLQVAEADPSARDSVSCLLNHCPHGGTQLANVLSDRHMALSIRKLAAEFIADVGYLEAVPALNRLDSRLEARTNGHNLDELTEEDGDIYLLPAIKQALEVLRSP